MYSLSGQQGQGLIKPVHWLASLRRGLNTNCVPILKFVRVYDLSCKLLTPASYYTNRGFSKNEIDTNDRSVYICSVIHFYQDARYHHQSNDLPTTTNSLDSQPRCWINL